MVKRKYFRGISRDFNEGKSIVGNLVPSLYREGHVSVKKESNIYEKYFSQNRESLGIYSNWGKTLFNENQTVKKIIKCIGKFQHYGLRTRLLDVTRQKEVAEYFCCSDDFEKTGYVFEFKLNSRKTEAPSTLACKLKPLGNFKPVGKKNMSLDENVIFEYSTFLKTKSNNQRYSAQKGAFVLFAQNPNKINELLPIQESDVDIYRINGDQKIKKLYELTKKESINFVKLFPDHENSIKLKGEYLLIKNDCLIFKKYINKIHIDGRNLDVFKTTLKEMAETLISNEDLFYFVFHEYLKYYTSVKNNRVELRELIK